MIAFFQAPHLPTNRCLASCLQMLCLAPASPLASLGLAANATLKLAPVVSLASGLQSALDPAANTNSTQVQYCEWASAWTATSDWGRRGARERAGCMLLLPLCP